MTLEAAVQPRKGLQRFLTRVLAVERPSDSLILFKLERPGGAEFGFEPGQFTYIYPPGSEERRAYSIASAPYEADHLAFCIKKVDGGPVSTALYGLNEGDKVHITRALGGFRFVSPRRVLSVFLCTGTGVAPLRSMTRQLIHDRDPRQLWLFLGSRDEANLPYHNEFLGFDQVVVGFHYVPVLSKAPMTWEGDRGWIQESFLRRFYHDFDYHAYICGVKRMVEDVRLVLKERGLGRDAIHLERYD